VGCGLNCAIALISAVVRHCK